MWRVLLPILALVCLLLIAPAGASAQTLPSGPLTALDGRLAVGAEVSASVGPTDQEAYFNFTDYEHDALRMFRVAIAASWRPASRIALVGEIRSEDLNIVRPYAAYVRVRPWAHIDFDIQAGQIPPSFGAFGRRSYQGADNAFVGYPLAYQYLTAVRADAGPATIADIISMRGRGWRTSYPIGSSEPGPGVPLVSGFRWDTGVQAHWQNALVDLTGSVTTGTLSDPQGSDNNDGKQVSARVALRPLPGLVAGASVARGDFLANSVRQHLADPDGTYAQTALGADAEYSRDHWLVRGEFIWSQWNVATTWPAAKHDLSAAAVWIEGRYRLTPRIVVAARADRLGFSRLPVNGGATMPWDAPVRRVEVDAGYYLQRNLVARIAVQRNHRDGGRVMSRTYCSGQISYWF
jgi:hypothetical protein